MRLKLLFSFFFIFPLFIYAQLGQFKVLVLEESTREPMLGVSVTLLDPESKAQVKGRQTNASGIANIEAVNPGSYAVKISFVGMLDYEKSTIMISPNKTTYIGTVMLSEGGKKLDEVCCEGKSSGATVGH